MTTVEQADHDGVETRDFILISRSISRDLHADLSELLRNKKSGAHCCTLFLTTFGGDPNGGYRIARCLRHHYKSVRLVVPSFCKSAGTLIAISADEIGIGDLGELGPLDIQVSKPSEFQERGSGLDIQQALQVTLAHVLEVFRRSLIDIRFGGRLSTKLAGEFAATVAIGIASPLYSQIDPNRLGELQRAMRITHEYGKRLNAYTRNLREDALERLVAHYPAHGFVIDRKEAKELFHRVTPLTNEESAFCESAWNLLQTETESGPKFVTLTKETIGESDHGNTCEATPTDETIITEKPPDGNAIPEQ